MAAWEVEALPAREVQPGWLIRPEAGCWQRVFFAAQAGRRVRVWAASGCGCEPGGEVCGKGFEQAATLDTPPMVGCHIVSSRTRLRVARPSGG